MAANIIRETEAQITQNVRYGVSTAWLHHKGRNKHHYEHWVDYSINDPEHVIMGRKCPADMWQEMVMDRISASRTYLGDAYGQSQAVGIFPEKQAEAVVCTSPRRKKELEGLLRILNDKGEEKALWYIKHVYLKGKDK